jgi:glutathione S-transferase
MARMMVIEKGLQNRVTEILARTRDAQSPYYAVNPSGRVPYLVCEDGLGLEESAGICDYLDGVDGAPVLAKASPLLGLEAARLEARASSLMDGLAVWFRELVRPQDERSPTVIAHERARAQRLLAWWETAIDSPWMNGPLNHAQLRLGCGLAFALRIRGFDWRPAHPRLAGWLDGFAARPSFQATEPPTA